ncbi:hypothetical protein BH11PSE2_BH11PSE2_12950 [soil metagenome]
MRKITTAAVLGLTLGLVGFAAQAQPAAAPAAPAAAAPAGKLTSDSTLTALMADAKAKDVLKKSIPQVVDFLDGGGAGQLPPEMTLKDLSGIEQAGITPELLKTMSDDLAKL